MKLPNSYGSITKYSGKRRKPWVVRLTSGFEYDPAIHKRRQIQKILGCYATREEAIRALADYNDNPYDLNYMTTTFADCYEIVKKDFSEGRKHNYYAAYKYLEPIKDLPIRSIKAPAMQKCIDACSTTQQREIVTVCHKVFAYALKMEIIDRDPSQYLHNNTVDPEINRNVFTADEIADIQKIDTWWRVCLACLLYSGMRSKELRTLSADDIDLNNDIIHIRQAKNKSSVRDIPIHAHAVPYFRAYKEHGLGFYGKTHNGFNKAIRTHFTTEHHAHDTRHTFATQARLCGVDPLVLQKLLGHTPETITERIYTHITLDEMRTEINKLSYEIQC